MIFESRMSATASPPTAAPPSAPAAALTAAVETTGLYTTKAGVARYVRGLLRGLSEIDHPGLSVREFAWPVENFGYQQPARMLRTAYRELVWARGPARRELRRMGADVLHATCGWMVTPPRGVRHVVTLHDLAFLRHPERFRRWQRASGGRLLNRLHRADRVICISRFTADEAMELLDLPAAKIEVVHNGFDALPETGEAPAFEVPGEFFLFVGSLEPGKNLSLLRETYLMAESEGRPLPPLMIVGARWEGVARESAAPKDWHYLGRQSDGVLVHLYRRALALAFPSKYEGFGLPVLEAMAAGCPVVCSPVASLPEVAGDAAAFADLTPADYLRVLRRVAGDSIYRDELIECGTARTAAFSWRKCAAETADVYRGVP